MEDEKNTATAEKNAVEMLGTIAETMERLQRKAEGRSVDADMTIFEPKPDHYIVNRYGQKVRHENGEAVIIGHVNDDKKKVKAGA